MLLPYLERGEKMQLLAELGRVLPVSAELISSYTEYGGSALRVLDDLTLEDPELECYDCRRIEIGIKDYLNCLNWGEVSLLSLRARSLLIPQEVREGLGRYELLNEELVNGYYLPELMQRFGDNEQLVHMRCLFGNFIRKPEECQSVATHNQHFFVVHDLGFYPHPKLKNPAVLLAIQYKDLAGDEQKAAQQLDALAAEALYEQTFDDYNDKPSAKLLILPLEVFYAQFAGPEGLQATAEEKVEIGKIIVDDILTEYATRYQTHTLVARQYQDDFGYQNSWVVLADGRELKPNQVIEASRFHEHFESERDKIPYYEGQIDATVNQMVAWNCLPEGCVAIEVRLSDATGECEMSHFATFRGKTSQLTKVQKQKIAYLIRKALKQVNDCRVRRHSGQNAARMMPSNLTEESCSKFFAEMTMSTCCW